MQLDEKSPIFTYTSEGQQDLIRGGYHILEHVNNDRSIKFDDYSFVVFPFAKAYEGFLKQVFLDRRYISKGDYISKYFRIGKAMSPNLVKRYGDRSVYKQICDDLGCELSEKIWLTWKKARNLVFHYFPHNLRSLTLADAEARIKQIIDTMEEVIEEMDLEDVDSRVNNLSQAEVKQIREELKKK